MPSKVEDLARAIEQWSLSQCLRAAAIAVEREQLDAAEIFVTRANDLLAAHRLFGVAVK